MEGFEAAAEAVLFDMDGTLVDSTAVTVECWTRWAAEYGVGREEFARVHAHGRPSAEIIADLLPAGEVAAANRRIEELEVAAAEGVRVLPGTRELLAALPARRWAVVTSCTAPLAEARLAAAGIEPPELVTADDVARGKPDPEPFALGARRLGAEPGRCVAVEDAPAGLASARAAGMVAIAVATSHSPEALTADVVVTDLRSVRARVEPDGVRLWAGPPLR
ncbi:sugar-phosphatase [Allonocardiopsis opalescens]|uniref:Sugar-phosphatase n=1 Tax=Allonocardiopsis opalescens TaxID=1144618 RepID=A0A2T0PTQ1_9ACTN|nr:sugar-phosphatase [Allonocardiopsis opalescens]